MQVRTIKEISGKRVNIVMEDGFSFVLYKGEVRIYGIEEGKDISENNFDTIINSVLPKRATVRAMNLLKVRPYTVKGLTDKLIEGGYPDNAVKAALDYVFSYHYLDDEQYARDYVDTYKDRKNKAKLRQDLMTKGVSSDIIDMVFEEELEDNDLEIQQIQNFMRKKSFDSDNASYEEKMKFMASLCRKGYSPELVRRVVEKGN